MELTQIAVEPGPVQLLKPVFDALPAPMLIYGSDFRIAAVNRAAAAMLRIPADRLEGRLCGEAFGCPVCLRECGLVEGLQRPTDSPQGVLRIPEAEGERLAFLATTPLFDSSGKIQAVAVSFSAVEQAPLQRPEVIAESAQMQFLLSLAKRIACSQAMTVLVQGESGTGKDLIAKLIHAHSPRASKPFIAINCAAVPETLLESELFGYEKGAFTDARSQKKGLLELAENGTLLLDEIGELPLQLQAKLLRVIEEQRFRRLGGLEEITLNVRIVAATNRDLLTTVRQGRFRQDLYYRLNVIQLVVKPLRERRADIAALARHFVKHFNRKFNRSLDGISEEALEMMRTYDWPGNVRELRNALERAVLLEDSAIVNAASLPVDVRLCERLSDPDDEEGPQNYSLKDHERALVEDAMQKAGGNQIRAARTLGITRDRLRSRLKSFNIKRRTGLGDRNRTKLTA